MLTLSLLLAAALQEPLAPAEELRVRDLRAHVHFLASDELEGRESGERGGRLAGLYVASQFRRFGLEPLPGLAGGEDPLRHRFVAKGRACFNVVGVVPGSDPQKAGKYLVVGAHHDHAGVGGPGAMGFAGEIHNGADDNASGTAGVLELAQWYARHPAAHSLIFVTFSAEERGLDGSRALVRDEDFPLEDVVAMVNLDMIGRSVDDYLFVGGLGTAAEFHDLLDPLLEDSGLQIETADGGRAPSDNSSFFLAGVPALFFFTNVHEDYHMPSDDAPLLNYAGERRILELVRATIGALDGQESLAFQEQDEMALPADFGARMSEHYQRIGERIAKKGKLGVVLEGPGEGGLVLAEVTAGSAAEAAGLQPGDVLLRLGGRRTRTVDDLRRGLGGRLAGDRVEIVLRRGGEERSVTAVLTKDED